VHCARVGVLCGLGISGSTGEGGEGGQRQRSAVQLSGVAEVAKSFRAGFEADMGAAGAALSAGKRINANYRLWCVVCYSSNLLCCVVTFCLLCFKSSDQWRRIYLCRALCQWDRDIILLQGPTQHMSELEERRFLEALRPLVRPGQVVLVTSVRHEAARYADLALLFERGVGVRALDPGSGQPTKKISS
jgi:ABC-type protease/lipase transport system fused ATPase/permease subunit